MGQQDDSSPEKQVPLSELASNDGSGSQATPATLPIKDLNKEWQGSVRERPTFQQFKGAYLAEMVLWAIFFLLLMMLLTWWAAYPTVADVEKILGQAASGNAVDIGKERLQVLQNLRAEHVNAFRELFQLVIVSVLVPIFTLVAGYAFGSREAEKAGNQQK